MPWPTPTEKVAIGWHAPPYASRDYAVLDTIDELMTGGRSARLRRRLVDDLELVSELRGGASGLRYGGLFELWLSMREGHAASEAIAIVDEEIERLCRERVAETELEKVKNRAELFFLSEIETVSGRASQIGFGRTVADDPVHSFVRLEELRAVTPDDVRRVARAILQPGRRSIVHVVPREEASA